MISERVGVVNVAIEGQLLAGAFVSAVVGSLTKNLFAGLIAAMVAGVLVSFVLAAFAIKYLVDQVIVGVVLNVLVLGLTSFLYTAALVPASAALNSPPQFEPIAIPLLSSIPIIGPVLFDQTLIVYIMYVAVAAVTIGLFATRWGLRLRAVGEHPQAADTVGINVSGTRFWNVVARRRDRGARRRVLHARGRRRRSARTSRAAPASSPSRRSSSASGTRSGPRWRRCCSASPATCRTCSAS